ncbi:uncharacterized protein LOC135483238 [Lineus longissimus]|uniref:uncharacterized protein LOC135483238 n=1 Tax=Lineus longissimus TaxID=88925 RepID=UPI002B4E7DED
MVRHPTTTLFLLAYMFQNAFTYIDITPPRNDQYVHRTSNFYFVDANYTVGPELKNGFLDILELDLTPDSWVIVFKLSNNYRRHVNRPCQTRHLQNDLILKVYDQNSKIRDGDNPDGFHVTTNSVLCILALHKDSNNQAWGALKYRYEDTERRSVGYLSSTLRYTLRMNVATLTRCVRIKPEHSLAISFLKNLKNQTSADRVIIKRRDYGVTRICNPAIYGRRTACYEQNLRSHFQEVMTMSAQTPSMHYPTPKVVPSGNGSEVCFYFEAINGREFKEDVQIQLADYPECIGNVTDQMGIFTSPGYPEAYAMNLSCSWNMLVEPGQRILLRLEDTQSDCVNDFVKLDGVAGSLNNAQILCGTSMTGSSFLSASNWLTLTFRTNMYKTLKGFLANYTAIGCSLNNTRLLAHTRILNHDGGYIPPGFRIRVGCERGYIFPSRVNEASLECLANNTWGGYVPFCVKYSVCNGTLASTSGSITSPDYPKPYPRDISCEWRIKVEDGQTVQVRIEDIKSNCVYDYILLDESANITDTSLSTEDSGPDTNATASPVEPTNGTLPTPTPAPQTTASRTYMNQIICSDTAVKGNVYESRGNTMSIIFLTSVHDGSGYFKLSYKATGCSLDSSTPVESYRVLNPSMNYPIGYQLEVGCKGQEERFSTGDLTITVICQENGKWKGTIPLCVWL